MEKFYPQKLKGKFDLGFALSLHYFSPMSGSGRTSLGEKLYQFKYKQKQEYLPDIVEAAAKFIEENKFYGGEFYYADMIIGMPPSNENKEWQPSRILAKEIGNKINKFVAEYVLRKKKPTPDLKNIKTREEKESIIKDSIGFTTEKARNIVKGKTILLIDDLYDTGATADEATRVLKEEGGAKAVYFLAITRTQS